MLLDDRGTSAEHLTPNVDEVRRLAEGHPPLARITTIPSGRLRFELRTQRRLGTGVDRGMAELSMETPER
jgi:hypothetical protein